MSAEDPDCWDVYPIRFVALSNLLSLSIYAIGALIVLHLDPFAAALYLLYCAALEIRLIRRSCTRCYYYGRRCCFGKGALSSLIFDRDDEKAFADESISWLAVLPDFMVTIAPLLAGIVVLIDQFSWTILALAAVLVFLGFPGSAVIRGSCACKHCKQRTLGCPAQELFEKRTSRTKDPAG